MDDGTYGDMGTLFPTNFVLDTLFQSERQIKPTKYLPPIHLHLIFAILQIEISSLMNLIFSLFPTEILQATAGRKIQFKLGKNPVYQTRYFKLENCKNQVQIDRR